jgi:SET domain-containing protein
MRKLPHEGVYTRIKPSNIHGVGVFAISDIPKGTYVFVEDDEEIVWVDKSEIENLPASLKLFYTDFCIIKGNAYGCPRSFNSLTTSWYLNHSEDPNVAPDANYRFYALRHIIEGEELTADYRVYSDVP